MLNRIRTALWMLLVVAGAALIGTKGPSLMQRLSSPAACTKPHATSTYKVSAKPIDQVHLGQRVPGENPVEAPDERYGKEVDQATWRRVDLRCAKRDGSDADVSLLRPMWWLEQQGAKVGGHLRIAVPECGIDGDAFVLALEPCPPIQPGGGNVVTGTFRHRNAKVIDLFIEGIREPIGTTPNHRFWSEDRKAFIRADQLRNAERLKKDGSNYLVSKSVYRSDSAEVYNLECYPYHVYQISESARLLVHNSDPVPPPPPDGFTRVGRWMSPEEYAAMMSSGRVQPPFNQSAQSFVTVPPNQNAFRPVDPKSVFVEYDVPTSRLEIHDPKAGWGKVNGPGSLQDRFNAKKGLPAIQDFPEVKNLRLVPICP